MRTSVRNILALFTAFGLAACSTVHVTTNFDHSAPFEKYQTYTIAPPAHGQHLSAANEAILINAIRTQLAARGMTEAKTGKGQLAIVTTVFTTEKVSVQQYANWGYGNGWPYAYGAYGMWNGAPSTYTNVINYTEGTLILDAVDTHTSKLVFRGTATAVVGGHKSNARAIEDAVAKMAAALPVKQ